VIRFWYFTLGAIYILDVPSLGYGHLAFVLLIGAFLAMSWRKYRADGTKWPTKGVVVALVILGLFAIGNGEGGWVWLDHGSGNEKNWCESHNCQNPMVP